MPSEPFACSLAVSESSPVTIPRKMFTKASTVPKLSPDQLKRQSLITHLACSLSGNSTEAIQFLNHSDQSLGGRPLDLATTSASGFSVVEQAIRMLAETPSTTTR